MVTVLLKTLTLALYATSIYYACCITISFVISLSHFSLFNYSLLSLSFHTSGNNLLLVAVEFLSLD